MRYFTALFVGRGLGFPAQDTEGDSLQAKVKLRRTSFMLLKYGKIKTVVFFETATPKNARFSL